MFRLLWRHHWKLLLPSFTFRKEELLLGRPNRLSWWLGRQEPNRSSAACLPCSRHLHSTVLILLPSEPPGFYHGPNNARPELTETKKAQNSHKLPFLQNWLFGRGVDMSWTHAFFSVYLKHVRDTLSPLPGGASRFIIFYLMSQGPEFFALFIIT